MDKVFLVRYHDIDKLDELDLLVQQVIDATDADTARKLLSDERT